MAKAKVIEGLNPHAPTWETLPVLFSIRITELWDLARHMPFPDRVRELHDMRIAAKRVRYCFEFFQPCFDEGFSSTLKQFKKLQDFLGEIHDCDVWVDYLRDQLKDSFKEMSKERRAIGMVHGAMPVLKQQAAALQRSLKRGPSQGLLMMMIDVVDRRQMLYEDLLVFWQDLEAQGFRRELTEAVARASQPPRELSAADSAIAQEITRPPREQDMVKAALDIGSNSIKLLVLELGPDGYSVLREESRVTRLGRGVAETGRLDDQSIEDSLKCLREFVSQARLLGAVQIRAAGTAALRSAQDSERFTRTVKDELGLEIEILGGEAEAELSRKVALQELPGTAENVVFFDVGGGSTELTWYVDGAARDDCSIDLGARRLTEIAGVFQPVADEVHGRMAAIVRADLEEHAPETDRIPVLAGLGGTASTIIWLLRGLRGEKPGSAHLGEATLQELQALLKTLKPLNLDGVKALPNLDPSRADVIYAGTAIIAGIMEFYRAERFTVVDRGLRYGLILG